METRYFECVNEKSEKFWIIETDDDLLEMITRFGRIGNGEQVSIKEFCSIEEMEKKANSLVKSKLKKGYKEILE